MIPTEHDEQAALFDWAKYAERWMPELELMFAIPNGGERHRVVAAKMKAEGVKPGVPDIQLPVARQGFHGLFIEMKREGGRVRPSQKWWEARLLEQGYQVVICWSYEDAKLALLAYLGYYKDPTTIE